MGTQCPGSCPDCHVVDADNRGGTDLSRVRKTSGTWTRLPDIAHAPDELRSFACGVQAVPNGAVLPAASCQGAFGSGDSGGSAHLSCTAVAGTGRSQRGA